jgi:ABC-type sulfate transport system substrate-binding protein
MKKKITVFWDVTPCDLVYLTDVSEERAVSEFRTADVVPHSSVTSVTMLEKRKCYSPAVWTSYLNKITKDGRV